MLKKLTIGLGIATVALFITTLIIVPFAIKQQINDFTENKEINYGEEFEIEPTQPLVQFVLKNYSSVRLEVSYDDNIHIDFNGVALGNPVVEAKEKEEKVVVFVDREISSNAHKILSIIDPYQDITIYVPEGVKVDLLGDYHIRNSSYGVELDENELYEEDYAVKDGTYYMYRQAVRFTNGENTDAAVKKLTYAGYLMAVDYAQGDLDKPMYIDYTMKLKSDLFDNAQNLFYPISDYVQENSRVVSQAAINYVDKQMGLAYAMELRAQNPGGTIADEAQIVEREDGNYEIALPESSTAKDREVDSQIEPLEQEVENAREAFKATLASIGVLDPEADYYIDLFKI